MVSRPPPRPSLLNSLELDGMAIDKLRRRNRVALGVRAPQDLAINKEVPFSFLKNAPFSYGKSALEVPCHPKFEILPTSLLTNVSTFNDTFHSSSQGNAVAPPPTPSPTRTSVHPLLYIEYTVLQGAKLQQDSMITIT